MSEKEILVPESVLKTLLDRGDRVRDVASLSLACLMRIAQGTSEDPAEDAIRTIRGIGMIAAEDKLS